MRRLPALLLLGTVAACGETEVGRLEVVKKQVCTCKDVACAETAMKLLPAPDAKASHREQGIARDMVDCYAKLVKAEPAAPAPAE